MYYHLMQDDNPDTLQIAMAVDTAPGTVVMLMRLATAIKKRSTEELMGIKLRQVMLLVDGEGGVLPFPAHRADERREPARAALRARAAHHVEALARESARLEATVA